jgi:Flp pilus assembly protein CpaB
MLLAAAAGTLKMLAVAGIIVLPWSKPPEPSHEGEIQVPFSARAIPAYNRIVREDLLSDVAHGLWNYQWVPKGALPPEAITDASKIIGRVMDHDKEPSYVFTEGDFLPRGTRPGLVAGIPPGKRSLTIEAAKIPGLHGLRLGDRFDVLATMKLDKNQSNNGKGPPPVKEPEVRVLVNNGMMISPIRMRVTPTTTNSLLGGQRTSAKPVEEVVIAIDPGEIAELTAAMTLEAAITCVARSGHPDDEPESITPGLPPAPPPTTIEAIRGGKSETLYFPVELEQDDQTDRRQPLPRRYHHTPPQRLPVASNQNDLSVPHESR